MQHCILERLLSSRRVPVASIWNWTSLVPCTFPLGCITEAARPSPPSQPSAAGTTGPCTLAGLAVQQNCENLAPLVLSQLVRPGCAVFYGAIGGRADMKSLTPRFGTAEARLTERVGAQLARYYGLACRGGSGITDSPICDFQAGAQAMLHTLSILQNGPNFMPACGLLGSYVGASLAITPEDFEYAPFYEKGGPVKVTELFGASLQDLLADLNEVLVAR